MVIICHRGNILIYGCLWSPKREENREEVLKGNLKNVLCVGSESFGCGGVTVQRVDSVMVSPGALHPLLPSVSLRKGRVQ